MEGGGFTELYVNSSANSGKFEMISRSVSTILGMSELTQMVLPPDVVVTFIRSKATGHATSADPSRSHYMVHVGGGDNELAFSKVSKTSK